jgi:hypothetical protein
LSLTTSVFAGGTLDPLVKAAEGFAAAIQQQIAAVQSITSATELAEKTIAYADAKISYYKAFRAAMPDLTNIVTGREPRPQQVDKFRDAFRGSGEILEIAADKETADCWNDSQAILGSRKQLRNSTMLRNSKRLSSKISRAETLPAAAWKTNLPASDVPSEAEAILLPRFGEPTMIPAFLRSHR